MKSGTLSSLNKGIGDTTCITEKPWNLLAEDVSLPAAVIYESKLANNLRWMQSFAEKSGVKLAPHGKTTMTPELFRRQMKEGAWGISLATVNQVAIACHNNIPRVLMANQLVGKRNMEIIKNLLSQIEFYCLADSLENIHQLGTFFAQSPKPLNLLIELGVPQGRCGCRTKDQAVAISAAIQQYDCLQLVGVEVYEGMLDGENAETRIAEYLSESLLTIQHLLELNVFDTNEVILTGAGSKWYDQVAECFSQINSSVQTIALLRPGCYLIHDGGVFRDAQAEVMKRSRVAKAIEGDLQSCLEVWAYVQSLPEPGLAIVAMGKRDAAYDAGLPQPAQHYRPGTPKPQAADSRWKTINIMDQHTFIQLPIDANINVGDMIAFSTSHPCLTFDKWRTLCLIDDNYSVIQCMDTYF